MAVTCGTGDDEILSVLRVLLEVVTGIPGSRACDGSFESGESLF